MTNDVFEDLVNLYLDKEISPAQLRILKEELLRNSDRRSTFESYCRMHQATHFAALSASPVIPRLSSSLEQGRDKPAFFALSKQVLAAAAIITVIGSFATIYFNGPFGKSRIAPVAQSNLQPIETFAQEMQPISSGAPLEFFREFKAQNAMQESAFAQELRHARVSPEFQSTQVPKQYTWVDGELREQKRPQPSGSSFDFEYSSYEFRR